jgi:Caspase domain
MATNPPQKWAVLVGIDFYTVKKYRLRGAVNDVEDIASLFQQYYSPINIAKYVGRVSGDPNQQEPTGPKDIWPIYDNVTQQLNHIIEVASPGDHVYFHYSGHGTLCSTVNRNYQLGAQSDAALVLYDEASADNARYLHGIELASFFDQMIAQKLILTAVLDCCHSGGMSRAKYNFRGVPWDDQIASAYPVNYQDFESTQRLDTEQTRDARAVDFWLISPHGYSVIAACGPDEVAGEGHGVDKINHGLLSLHLLNSLTTMSKAGFKIDLEFLYRKISARMHVSFPNQHPLLLGRSSASFMGDTLSNKLPNTGSCEVVGVDQNGTILLNVGYAHGVCTGDEYRMYREASSSSSTTLNAQSGVHVTITTVTAFHSEAKVRQSVQGNSRSINSSRVARGWYGTLVKPFRPNALVQLFAGAGEEWLLEVNNSPWLQISDNQETAAFIPSFNIGINQSNEYEVVPDGYTRPLDMPSVAVGDRFAPVKIISVVEHMAKFASIEMLENPIASLMLEANDFSIDIQDLQHQNNLMHGNFLQVRDGGELRITFQNNSNRTIYCTILDLMPLGEISRLYPDDREYVTVPSSSPHFSGSESFEISMAIPDRVKSKGQSQSDDVLKFFITSQPTSFDMLQLQTLSTAVSEQNRSSSHFLWNFLSTLESDGPVPDSSRSGFSSKERKWVCENYTIRTIS